VALVVTSPPYFAGKAYEAELGTDHIPATYVEYLTMLEDVFSGRQASAGPAIAKLGVPDGVPIVTRDLVPRAKPDPDLFLEAVRQLGVAVEQAMVVGDSVWDMLAAQRARTLAIGVLSGGYGASELEQAGAYRVYDDPADLLEHLDEVGVR
jgi:phosphoglycolate phosphatase-like HAD superfamily hydrolase